MQNERDTMAKGESKRANEQRRNDSDNDDGGGSGSGGDQTILAASVTNAIYKLVTSDLSCI